jgi:CRISPR-associated protein Cmr6
MVDRFAFPTAIRAVLSEQVRSEKETHAGLWFDKYIIKQNREDPESRRALIKEVSALPTPAAYEAFYKHWEETLASYGAKLQRASVKGRMIVGLGSESVLETSICLHRTYGVPYIPGSALKGLAANYARLYLGADWQQKDGKYYKVVFGNTDDAGYITFFDAFYIPGTGHTAHDTQQKRKALYPDVITVHHQKYYQGQATPPADRDSPNPIPFLSATGTYLLALAAPDLDLQVSDVWLSATFKMLEYALGTLGIGAKTSSGYGRMEFVSPPAQPVDPELRKVEGYKREIDALRDVAGQIHGYYQKWQQLTSKAARMLLAQAIVEKVRQAGREKQTAEKAWHKELVAYLTNR